MLGCGRVERDLTSKEAAMQAKKIGRLHSELSGCRTELPLSEPATGCGLRRHRPPQATGASSMRFRAPRRRRRRRPSSAWSPPASSGAGSRCARGRSGYRPSGENDARHGDRYVGRRRSSASWQSRAVTEGQESYSRLSIVPRFRSYRCQFFHARLRAREFRRSDRAILGTTRRFLRSSYS